MMRKAVLGLTREQVAGGLVSFIQGLEAEVSRQSVPGDLRDLECR